MQGKPAGLSLSPLLASNLWEQHPGLHFWKKPGTNSSACWRVSVLCPTRHILQCTLHLFCLLGGETQIRRWDLGLRVSEWRYLNRTTCAYIRSTSGYQLMRPHHISMPACTGYCLQAKTKHAAATTQTNAFDAQDRLLADDVSGLPMATAPRFELWLTSGKAMRLQAAWSHANCARKWRTQCSCY